MKRIQYLLFYNMFVIENTEINKISKNDFIDTNWKISIYYSNKCIKSIKYIKNIINFDRTSQSSSDRIWQSSSVEINNISCILCL